MAAFCYAEGFLLPEDVHLSRRITINELIGVLQALSRGNDPRFGQRLWTQGLDVFQAVTLASMCSARLWYRRSSP